jgi:CHAT domain-containing protein
LLRGTNKTQEADGGEKAIQHVREGQKGVEGWKPFKKDGRIPFAHPYYWSSFILIGNWL